MKNYENKKYDGWFVCDSDKFTEIEKHLKKMDRAIIPAFIVITLVSLALSIWGYIR